MSKLPSPSLSAGCGGPIPQRCTPEVAAPASPQEGWRSLLQSSGPQDTACCMVPTARGGQKRSPHSSACVGWRQSRPCPRARSMPPAPGSLAPHTAQAFPGEEEQEEQGSPASSDPRDLQPPMPASLQGSIPATCSWSPGERPHYLLSKKKKSKKSRTAISTFSRAAPSQNMGPGKSHSPETEAGPAAEMHGVSRHTRAPQEGSPLPPPTQAGGHVAPSPPPELAGGCARIWGSPRGVLRWAHRAPAGSGAARPGVLHRGGGVDIRLPALPLC